jgi:hypothetical protein
METRPPAKSSTQCPFIVDWSINQARSRNPERLAQAKQSAVVPTLVSLAGNGSKSDALQGESPMPQPATARFSSKLLSFNPQSQTGGSTKFTTVSSVAGNTGRISAAQTPDEGYRADD